MAVTVVMAIESPEESEHFAVATKANYRQISTIENELIAIRAQPVALRLVGIICAAATPTHCTK
jgi:hypothetical protein